jgi:hypothetical protein
MGGHLNVLKLLDEGVELLLVVPDFVPGLDDGGCCPRFLG